nr:probable carboxylesterase 18 [Ipomoea batatas]
MSSSDVQVEASKDVWFRLFVPEVDKHEEQQSLPLIVYFHGGDFTSLSPDLKARTAVTAAVLLRRRADGVGAPVEESYDAYSRRGIDDTAVPGGGARQPVAEDNIRAGKDTDAALRVVEVVDSMRVVAEDIDVALPGVDDTTAEAAAGDDNIRAAGAVEAVGYNIQTDEVAAAADRYSLPF